jgi:hypothetical protein
MVSRRILFYVSYSAAMLLLTVSVMAQALDCPNLVQRAFQAAEQFCSETERNSVCYGANRVDAAFYTEVSDDFFTSSGDFSPIGDVETLQTSPLDLENDLWGVAVMQVQANLPNTLPGQNVVFLLLGETQLVDDVPEDVALPNATPIDVTVNADANVRSGPSQRNNVVAALAAGETVQADGLSEDGTWARVLVDGRPGWVFGELLTGDLSDLPVVEGLLTAPMQAFHMTTAINSGGCVQAPNAVIIQGIKDFEVEFQANGAKVRISSTALLELIAPDIMQITMLDGLGWVNNLRVPAGWKAQIDLDPEGGVSEPTQLVGLPEIQGLWTNCEPLSADDLARIESLTTVPAGLLNYQITVPISGAGACVPADAPTSASTQSQTGICNGLSLLGPFENITPRPTTFRWTRLQAATDYELVFYSVFTGQVAGTFRTPDTNLTVTLGQVSTGSEMQWEVRAYRDNDYLCVTPRTPVITLLGDPFPPPVVYVPPISSAPYVPPPAVFGASAFCFSPTQFIVLYGNAPAGSTSVDLVYEDSAAPGVPITVTSLTVPTGNVTSNPLVSFTAINIQVVAQPSGTTIPTSPNTIMVGC